MFRKYLLRFATLPALLALFVVSCNERESPTGPTDLAPQLSSDEAEPGTDADGVGTTEPTIGSLISVVNETGKISLSIDGLGTLAASGIVEVEKPSAGATVRGAYLAVATTGFFFFSLGPIADNQILLAGTPVAWDIVTQSSISSWNHWADVTSIVKPAIDPLAAGRHSFAVSEQAAGSNRVDGSILAVIFDDPSQTEDRTVDLQFGAQDVDGDNFQIVLADPIDTSDPNLVLDMSLGISYGFQPSDQFSFVDVNGTRLTSCAGGQDDGIGANGALLTVGGLDDSNTNPAPTCNSFGSPTVDDELYDLRPFTSDGDTQVDVFTQNPSNDDNIFFAAFLISGEALVTTPDDVEAPLCEITDSGVDGDGKKFIEITTQDLESGLLGIDVTLAKNATVNVPAFSAGTNDEVIVIATKIDQGNSSRVELEVSDVAGNVTVCDPVDVDIDRDTGKPHNQVLTDVPEAEHWVDIHNASPGIKNLVIYVNGEKFHASGLKDDETRTIDVASAMRPGNDNTIRLEARGKPGGSAWVLIHD